MYRKITHNIVEEHFDHPMAEQIKKTLDNKVGRPTDTIFDKAEFETNAKTFVNEYARKLTEMLKSMQGTGETALNYFESIFDGDIDMLGDMTKDFYQYELGEKLNIIMRGLAVATYTAAMSRKFGKVDQAAATRLRYIPGDAGQTLSSFNEAEWSFGPVQTIFADIVSSLGKLTESSLTTDVAKIDSDTATVMANFARFVDVFLSGIFRTFPDRFTAAPAAATTRRAVSSNIM